MTSDGEIDHAPANKQRKKKKSVKFTEEKPVAEKKTEQKGKKRKITVTEEVPVDESGKKSKTKKKRSIAKESKRQKLMESVIAPELETVDFLPDQKAFTDFGLDERLLKVIGELGWKHPTQVQESVISLMLEGKNVMARARTGSGKTGAFLLPIVQRITQHLLINPQDVGPFAIVIAPTKELATQIYKLLSRFLTPLPFISALNLSELTDSEKEIWEQDCPSIVVSTPGKIVQMCKLRSDFCRSVSHLVLDEADLLLSFGYENEMSQLKEFLPPNYQCVFTSATLTDDMTFLKKIFMTGPVLTIKLKEGDLPDADQLSQFHITCQSDEERFAIMVAMVKLKLIVGKTIIFVNDTNRCYKLSLVLRTFGVKSCILNSEMPANSRCHVINQFNDGLFSIIIASDSFDVYGAGNEEEAEEQQKSKKKPRDKEAGVSRGIDFHHVSNVVNFDFPTTTDTYIHRVGRTARGWNKGTALSFCTPVERPLLDSIQEEINSQLPYEIRIKELDSFVLRTRESLLKCTKSVIKKARMREIKLELMRSAKLEGYFAANPREKDVMATTEHPVTLRLHSAGMADVPDYIVPQALKGMDFSSGPAKKKSYRKKKKQSVNQRKYQKQQKNPLKSFSAR